MLVSVAGMTPCPPPNLLSHQRNTFPVPPPLVDPEGKTASARVALGFMERIERLLKAAEYGLKEFHGIATAANPWELPPAAVVANASGSS